MFERSLTCCFAVVTLFAIAKSEDCKTPTPEFMKDASQCCKMDMTEYDEILEDCGGKGQPPTCEVMDCGFQKMKFVKDGKLDYAAIEATLDEDVGKMPEFKEAFQKVKETCHKDLSGVAPGIPCDSLKTYICSHTILISECPDSMWTKSPQCDTVKETLKNCPNPFS